jgi:pyruvate/2-oxoglutarate dehydrogenase complex dihydrolipoamide dehydrogenase (E3) component
MSRIKADLCIIGAGSGGLSVAAGAAQLGQKVVLIERHKMGGDCLNYGCVPSKSLIAAASHARAARRAPLFGVDAGEPKVDFARVMRHVQEVIAAIEPNDSVERFEKLGVRVIKGAARFVGPTEVEVDGQRIGARYFIVATGSAPLVPAISGLDQTPYFTNETVFDNTVLPEHLIIIGGGPIGLELAQAHRRLGARVTVLEAKSILPKDDAEAVAIVREALTKEGVVIREGAAVTAVSKADGGVAVTTARNGQNDVIVGSHLLLAVGRAVNVGDLNLEAAGVKYSRKGVDVDAGLRSSNRRVYAIGDAAGGLQFTHVAGYHAGIIIRRLLFKVPAKSDMTAMPWCTYTDPELAHVGLTESQAREKGHTVSIARWPLHDNDRAQAERETHGLAKIVVVGGRVVGATVVAPHAGDLITPWVMAVGQKMKISAMAGFVAAYPTLGEISKRAAGAYFTPTLFSGRTRTLIKILSWFGPRA